MKNVFGINRHCRTQRRSLIQKLRGDSGAIDVASIMAGTIIISIIGGVIAATVFAVIPWAQDNAAKADLGQVRVAEGAYAASHGGGYGDLAALQASPAQASGSGAPGHPAASIRAAGVPLLQGLTRPLAINANTDGFIAATLSQTGRTFYIVSNNMSVSSTVPAVIPAGLTAPQVVDPAAAWSMPDPALRAYVLACLGLPADHTLVPTDMSDLTDLSWSAAESNAPKGADPEATPPTAEGVVSLAGLEAATNLAKADFYGSSVVDLTPLANLTGTTSLDLGRTKSLTDLNPISKLVNLDSLSLASSAVTDITPLAGMTKITAMNIQNTNISSIAAVANMKSLAVLFLPHTQVADLSPLIGNTTLQNLDIWYTPVSDLTPLSGLTTLIYLAADHTQIADLTPLTNLPLENLYLGNTLVADLTPLTHLPLTGLSIEYTHVTNLAPLANMSSLSYLQAKGLTISDWTPVDHVDYVEK